jgi:CheY-like chemotaxis protein
LKPEKPKSDAGQPASILVVDDTSANLQVLAGMLKDRGYKVRPVLSGNLALLAARHDSPDLILPDIKMPEMNGYEICEHLKADDQLKGIPVIFISALTEQLDKVKAFAIGGVDYISKPFQMEELHARVEPHLKLRRLQIELEHSNARFPMAIRCAGACKNVPQTGRPGFDEFLELERSPSGFEGVWDRTNARFKTVHSLNGSFRGSFRDTDEFMKQKHTPLGAPGITAKRLPFRSPLPQSTTAVLCNTSRGWHGGDLCPARIRREPSAAEGHLKEHCSAGPKVHPARSGTRCFNNC